MTKLPSAIIEGKKYEFGLWDVDKATEMLAYLLDVVAGAVKPAYDKLTDKTIIARVLDTDTGEISNAMTGLAKNEKDLELGIEVLDSLLTKFFEKIKPADYSARLRLIVEDGQQVLCAGNPIAYDSHFRGRIWLLNRVAFAILKAQYGDFLAAAPSTGEGGQKAAKPGTNMKSSNQGDLTSTL